MRLCRDGSSSVCSSQSMDLCVHGPHFLRPRAARRRRQLRAPQSAVDRVAVLRAGTLECLLAGGEARRGQLLEGATLLLSRRSARRLAALAALHAHLTAGHTSLTPTILQSGQLTSQSINQSISWYHPLHQLSIISIATRTPASRCLHPPASRLPARVPRQALRSTATQLYLPPAQAAIDYLPRAQTIRSPRFFRTASRPLLSGLVSLFLAPKTQTPSDDTLISPQTPGLRNWATGDERMTPTAAHQESMRMSPSQPSLQHRRDQHICTL